MYAFLMQVVLLIYTVIPLPLYLCILIGLIYSALFEMLAANSMDYTDTPGVKLILHLGIHLLGVHLFILTQGIICALLGGNCLKKRRIRDLKKGFKTSKMK